MKETNIEKQITEYLQYRRALGFKMIYQESILKTFARFARSQNFHGPLKKQWAEQFIYAPVDKDPAYFTSRWRVLRDFARYWAAFDPRVEIIEEHQPQIGYRRPAPYIFSDPEVVSLMQAARKGTTPTSFVGETYATIIGLMACSGLRRSEVVNLRNCDVDLNIPVLRIRESKNRPLRLVPIHDSATLILRDYTAHRDQVFSSRCTDHFFLNQLGRPVSANGFSDRFRVIRSRAGIIVPGNRQPRAHDLRHTFACNRLLTWIKDGKDVSRTIHLLATYLGHDGIKETYWYLSAVPALMEIVGRQFECYGTQTEGRDGK